jgi:small nuclear ribonucleoprotein (snRNP)-like protein
MTWYQLHKRICKQTLHKMQNTEVIVKLRDGTEHKCKLEFYNNGSVFRLITIN